MREEAIFVEIPLIQTSFLKKILLCPFRELSKCEGNVLDKMREIGYTDGKGKGVQEGGETKAFSGEG